MPNVFLFDYEVDALQEWHHTKQHEYANNEDYASANNHKRRKEFFTKPVITVNAETGRVSAALKSDDTKDVAKVILRREPNGGMWHEVIEVLSPRPDTTVTLHELYRPYYKGTLHDCVTAISESYPGMTVVWEVAHAPPGKERT